MILKNKQEWIPRKNTKTNITVLWSFQEMVFHPFILLMVSIFHSLEIAHSKSSSYVVVNKQQARSKKQEAIRLQQHEQPTCPN